MASVYRERAEELERLEFQYGEGKGRLALAQDLLTDALTLVGQHGVYCQSARQAGKPAMDLQVILKLLNDSKELVTGVMEGMGERR